MIAIVNYGGANLASILYALKRLNVDASVTCDKTTLQNASHVILPGVGHARVAIQNLQSADLFSTIRNLKQPVLGICLGMQLLYEYLEEAEGGAA